MLVPDNTFEKTASDALAQQPVDPFRLFSLAPVFALDLSDVRARYFHLRRCFAQDAAALAAINAAYQTLTHSVLRADYLLAKREVYSNPHAPLPADCAALYELLEESNRTLEEKRRCVCERLQEAEAAFAAAYAADDPAAMCDARQRLAYVMRLQDSVWA